MTADGSLSRAHAGRLAGVTTDPADREFAATAVPARIIMKRHAKVIDEVFAVFPGTVARAAVGGGADRLHLTSDCTGSRPPVGAGANGTRRGAALRKNRNDSPHRPAYRRR